MRASVARISGRAPVAITAVPRAAQRRTKSASAATPVASIIGTSRMRRMNTFGTGPARSSTSVRRPAAPKNNGPGT